MQLFAYRMCGAREVFCDGSCWNCLLRWIKTEDGEYLYPGEQKEGDSDGS